MESISGGTLDDWMFDFSMRDCFENSRGFRLKLHLFAPHAYDSRFSAHSRRISGSRRERNGYTDAKSQNTLNVHFTLLIFMSKPLSFAREATGLLGRISLI
jgi:hypothetical protein